MLCSVRMAAYIGVLLLLLTATMHCLLLAAPAQKEAKARSLALRQYFATSQFCGAAAAAEV